MCESDSKRLEETRFMQRRRVDTLEVDSKGYLETVKHQGTRYERNKVEEYSFPILFRHASCLDIFQFLSRPSQCTEITRLQEKSQKSVGIRFKIVMFGLKTKMSLGNHKLSR